MFRLHAKPGPGEPWRFDPISIGTLCDAKFHLEPRGKPEHPAAPHGEWYCHGEDCPARQVTVRLRLIDRSMPAVMP